MKSPKVAGQTSEDRIFCILGNSIVPDWFLLEGIGLNWMTFYFLEIPSPTLHAVTNLTFRNVACDRGQEGNENLIESDTLNVHIDYKKVSVYYNLISSK